MIKKKIEVSELFVETYINFNVTDQTNQIRSLSKREIYLLLIYVIDRHDEYDPVVVRNLREFESEMLELVNIQDDLPTKNQVILDLINETGNRYIETDNIVDRNGKKLKNPLNKQQVRQEKIKRITKK